MASPSRVTNGQLSRLHAPRAVPGRAGDKPERVPCRYPDIGLLVLGNRGDERLDDRFALARHKTEHPGGQGSCIAAWFCRQHGYESVWQASVFSGQ